VNASLAPFTGGNYRLAYASPAIDSGHTLSVTVPTDLDGLPRLVGPDVDRGGYEWQNYTLTVAQVGEGVVDIVPDWAGYTYLDEVVLTATAVSGWTFVGWSGDVVAADNPLTMTITNHTAITATFAQETYSLTVDIVGAGAVSREPDQAVYLPGQVVTLTATADLGWTFANWSGDAVGTATSITHTITANTHITATFSQDAYSLTIDVVGAGTVSREPDQPTYAYGQVVTLTALADPDWTFTGWGGDSAGNANPLILTVNDDLYLTASFSQYRLYLPVIVR
jgi:uncharacterized repeat protein (TIGR02543 family)